VKIRRTALTAGFIAVAVAGCTYSNPPADSGPATTGPAPAASAASPATLPVVLEGTFQSQAAATTGTATIRVTESTATLEIKDFATEAGGELTVVFSPGTLSPDTDGELGLTSTQLNVIADLKLAQGSQQYELDPRMWAGLPSPVKSVVIYNFPAKAAYGTANLTEVPRP
jgi:hypothetical protein